MADASAATPSPPPKLPIGAPELGVESESKSNEEDEWHEFFEPMFTPRSKHVLVPAATIDAPRSSGPGVTSTPPSSSAASPFKLNLPTLPAQREATSAAVIGGRRADALQDDMPPIFTPRTYATTNAEAVRQLKEAAEARRASAVAASSGASGGLIFTPRMLASFTPRTLHRRSAIASGALRSDTSSADDAIVFTPRTAARTESLKRLLASEAGLASFRGIAPATTVPTTPPVPPVPSVVAPLPPPRPPPIDVSAGTDREEEEGAEEGAEEEEAWVVVPAWTALDGEVAMDVTADDGLITARTEARRSAELIDRLLAEDLQMAYDEEASAAAAAAAAGATAKGGDPLRRGTPRRARGPRQPPRPRQVAAAPRPEVSQPPPRRRARVPKAVRQRAAPKARARRRKRPRRRRGWRRRLVRARVAAR